MLLWLGLLHLCTVFAAADLKDLRYRVVVSRCLRSAAANIVPEKGWKLWRLSDASCCVLQGTSHEDERENYAEKGRNPFLHMLRKWALTLHVLSCIVGDRM